MHEPQMGRLLLGVFGATTVLLGVLGLLVSYVALGVAIPFGLATLLLWMQFSRGASGARARGRSPWQRRRRRQPGSASGRWNRANERTSAAGAAGATASGAFGPEDGRSRGRGSEAARRRAAYRVVGLEPGAGEDAIRRAYRERAKAVHPDRGGDPAAFRRLNRAYEYLVG